MASSRPRIRLAPEARRAQIVDIATQQIATSGFNTFTMSELAKAAGLSRAGIEHHFPTREDVLVAVLRHRDELDEAAVYQAFPPPPHDRDTAQALMAALVRRNSEQREIVRLYTILGAEALDPAHPAHTYFVERFAYARRLIASSTREWAEDPEMLAVELLGRMDGLQLQWLRDPSLDLVELWARAGIIASAS